MTAFNTVRFRVKPGRDREFLDAHRAVDRSWPGLNRVNLIQTGEHDYCIMGEWHGGGLHLHGQSRRGAAAYAGDSGQLP